MALVMGIEPTISTLTGWRLYRLASPAWNPMQDSNPQPSGPWPDALIPIELMGHEYEHVCLEEGIRTLVDVGLGRC